MTRFEKLNARLIPLGDGEDPPAHKINPDYKQQPSNSKKCFECGKMHDTIIEDMRTGERLEELDKCKDCLMFGMHGQMGSIRLEGHIDHIRYVTELIYKPDSYPGPVAIDCKMGVKFCKDIMVAKAICDKWGISYEEAELEDSPVGPALRIKREDKPTMGEM